MRHLYVGGSAEQGGIDHYIWENGELRFQERTIIKDFKYMIPQGNKMHTIMMHAFDGPNESGLQTFDIAPDGKLINPGPVISTKGSSVCHLYAKDDVIYCVNYDSGSVFATNGLFDQHIGHGPNVRRQESAHTHYINETPDGKYLLVTDLGMDKIFLYDFDLRVLKTFDVPAGHGPRHLSYSEDGKYIFCLNEMGADVSVFRYEDGNLIYLESVDGLMAPVENNTAAAIRVRGNRVYCSQRGAEVVSVFSWENEHLTLLDCFPCGGKNPRDMILVDDYVICANEFTNDATFLKLEGDTIKNTGIRLENPGALNLLVLDL